MSFTYVIESRDSKLISVRNHFTRMLLLILNNFGQGLTKKFISEKMSSWRNLKSKEEFTLFNWKSYLSIIGFKPIICICSILFHAHLQI